MQMQAAEPGNDLAMADEATKLQDHVQCRLGGRVCDFRLVVVGGGVILRGHAHTYYAKQVAQHAVMETTRLPILANQIEVS